MKDSTFSTGQWAEARPDALAFAGGLALAWFFQWKTLDLVWSLWLSSLVVGYATIVWALIQPWRIRAHTGATGESLPGLARSLFMLAFFTVHFGGFHFVHSVFLNLFFPVDATPMQDGAEPPSLSTYVQVVQQYWLFLPLAFIAERTAFKDRDTAASVVPDETKAHKPAGEALTAPYRNVIRMHLLIFFFAAVHFIGVEHFLIYAVVYAAYFFPWRLLKRRPVHTVTP